MKVFRSWEECAADGGIQRLAIGFFDGVHRGHRMVFEAARQAGPHFSILTFWPHPQTILAPTHSPALITGLEHKLHLFEQAGADSVLVAPFSRAFSLRTAGEFLDLLAQHLPGLQAISCGPNFHFGHARAGDAPLLVKWARNRGIAAELPPMCLATDGQPISSSRIRQWLREGRLDKAADALGRRYRIRGRVVTGKRLGRTIGFPTANLESDDYPLVPPGVYAGHTHFADGASHPTAINIGFRPTVDAHAGRPVVEAHLLGFQGELYGDVVEVEPQCFIRPEIRFADVTELRTEVARDVAKIGSILKGRPL